VPSPLADGQRAQVRARWGNQLRAARLARGLSQAQLAAVVGVSRPAVSEWERGLCAPTDLHRLSIARALHRSARTLFDLTEQSA